MRRQALLPGFDEAENYGEDVVEMAKGLLEVFKVPSERGRGHPLYFNAYRRSAACHRLSRSLLNLVTMAQQLRAGEGRKEAPSRWPWAALWHAYATGLEIQLYIVQLLWTLPLVGGQHLQVL